MNLTTPHIIYEGGNIYELGKLKGNRILYDFDKMLIYIEAKGKSMFGNKFRIFKQDKSVLFKLCNYIIRDKENCEKLGIDINKGILLTGPVGCGKTSLMKILRHLTPHIKPYQVIPTRSITFGFNHIGYKTIQDYGNEKYFCFDDLGVEPTGRHYGKNCNAQELENRYGNRVRSRMRELFNLIAFDKGSKDKRR